MNFSLCTAAIVLAFVSSAFAQGLAGEAPPPQAPKPPSSPYRISGLMFGDYYGVARTHLPAWEDQHGLWFRRIYFTLDYTFSPKVSTRFRLEMNSNGRLQGGSLTPYLKDAYLRWNAFGRQVLTAGIQPSLTFDYLESVWGLRHIEKTPQDLYRIDSSRDTGFTLAGPVNAAQTVKYAVQYGNESGNNSETDEYKAVRAAVRYEAATGFAAEGVVGHFGRPNGADRTTAQLFGAYRAGRGRVGASYTFQRRRATATAAGPDVDLDVVSGFAVVDVVPRRASAFLRVDRYADPCPDCAGIDYLPIDTKQRFTTTIAGVELFVLPSVRFSPNIEWVDYGSPASGSKPNDDVMVRLTFYWTW